MDLKSQHSRIDTYLLNEKISLRWSLHLNAVSCSFSIFLSQVCKQMNVNSWNCSIIILIFWLFFCSHTSTLFIHLFILLSFQRHFIEQSYTSIYASDARVCVSIKHAAKNRLSQPKLPLITLVSVARNVNTLYIHTQRMKAVSSSIASKVQFLWKRF